MSIKNLALAIFVTIVFTTHTFACNTVMGGCSKDPTHDTSTHMKSQIVNQISKHDLPNRNIDTANKRTSGNSKIIDTKKIIQGLLIQVLK